MTKRNKVLWWAGLLAGLVLINFLASKFHARYDLTEEKRYSLSRPTRELLGGLKEPVRVEVFLKGDFPAGFKQNQPAHQEKNKNGYISGQAAEKLS